MAPGVVTLADGSTVRGAKRGGITDHIAGPHLIPNVGREAMVPAEVVRRARPAPKRQPTAPPPPKAEKAQRAQKGGKKRRQRERERSGSEKARALPPRARSRRRSRSQASSASSRSPRPPEPPAKSAKEQEEDRQSERLREREAAERERKRQEEERRMLQELEEARKKRQEVEAARRRNLGGAFALTEDDIKAEESEEAEKLRAARELARAEERRAARERLLHGEPAAGAPGRTSSSSLPDRGAVVAAPLRLVNKDGVTAADIDGSFHEHKFAKVWKDWDASKKDDPGEIARQFMRVSAVKRRGYCQPKRSTWSRSPSRSRSRSRRR
uniref:Uncharacterized protein n=1 Tax=Alexandrium monilatum TaxID=311494 RepID=A0A7S4VYQ4_9DINO